MPNGRHHGHKKLVSQPGSDQLAPIEGPAATRNSLQQSIPLQVHPQFTQPHPPQSQHRKALQRHIESAAQHIEFDERQQNEGKIS